MATLSTRMLETKKERLVASFLIALGIPCAVQLGVLLAIMATAPFSILLITVTGIGLNKLIPTEQKAYFILELPPFRLPDPRQIVMKTFYRVKWFLVEAVPLFVLGAALMFALKITGLILVLSRRELGAVYFRDMVNAGQVDYYQTITGLVVITLFIPCISNTMVMTKELGLPWAVSINIFVIIIAILVGGLVNYLIRL
jgi:ferrous iron transport protein B